MAMLNNQRVTTLFHISWHPPHDRLGHLRGVNHQLWLRQWSRCYQDIVTCNEWQRDVGSGEEKMRIYAGDMVSICYMLKNIHICEYIYVYIYEYINVYLYM